MQSGYINKCTKLNYRISGIIMLFLISSIITAQEPPPRPVVITPTAQGLSFGAFYHGAAGGTVTISETGVRSSTGDVVLLSLGYTYTSALFEVVANPGTLISILNGPDAVLPGSNGGSITLQLGLSDPASPFVTTVLYPIPTLLNIGGTIIIGNSAANPPGNYSGTFDITFIQE